MSNSFRKQQSWMLLASAASILFTSTEAQIGVSLCACQPAYYEFTLNFALTCADQDVAGPGIVDTACVLNPQGGENVTDLTPAIVTEIQVLELDQNLQVVSQTTYEDTFSDGDIFNYTSITMSQTSELNMTSLPRGFQMFLTGRNAEEQDLVNFYAIVYDNDCGLFPLLEEGMVAGWTIFSDLGPPPVSVCPAVPTEGTSEPTIAPDEGTSEPTIAPDEETSEPTIEPDVTPTAPTMSPKGPPVDAPTFAPSDMMSDEPTIGEAPTCPPIGIKGRRFLMTGSDGCPEYDEDDMIPPEKKERPKTIMPVGFVAKKKDKKGGDMKKNSAPPPSNRGKGSTSKGTRRL